MYECLRSTAVDWRLDLFLRSSRYRPLAWMYLLPAAYFLSVQGVSTTLRPAYPMLIAMGAAGGERWVDGSPRHGAG